MDLELFNGKGFASVLRGLWEYDPLVSALGACGVAVALVGALAGVVRGRSRLDPRVRDDLLVALATQAGRALTRDQLVTRVWGYEAEGGTRLLDSHIAHLRAKIEPDPSQPRYIHTVRDVGYRLSPG